MDQKAAGKRAAGKGVTRTLSSASASIAGYNRGWEKVHSRSQVWESRVTSEVVGRRRKKWKNSAKKKTQRGAAAEGALAT